MCGRNHQVAILALLAWGVLACSGVATPTVCCDVEGVIRMTEAGVEPAVIVDTLRTSGTDLDLSDADVIRLAQAGVDREVIDVLNGGPCVCEVPTEPEEAAVVVDDGETGNSLRLAVNKKGSKAFEVVNLSSTPYTNVTVVLNGEYQYRLKKLAPNAGDSMRYGNFVSRRTGQEPTGKTKLQSLAVSADQGSFAKYF